MGDAVICLGCGGVVDEGAGIPAGEAGCGCPPPSREAPTVVCRGCGGSLQVGVRACPFCSSTAATRRCAHCSSWNLADAVHCQQCGRGLAQAPDAPGVRTGDPCPRCGHGLAARRYAELDVDECDGCGGLMLTPQTMDRLVAERDAPTGLRMALPKRVAAREERVVYLRCPACQKSMNRRAFGRISGVIVDVCREHGVWFDAGELAAVLAFIEQGGLARAREREQAELREARRALRAEQVALQSASLHQGSVVPSSRAGGIDLGLELVQALASLWQ